MWFPPHVDRHIVETYQLIGKSLGIWNAPVDGVVGEKSWAMMRSLGFDPDRGE